MRIRKVLSCVLVMAMILSISSTAFAISMDSNINGNIIYRSSSVDSMIENDPVVVTYVENSDGSITVYQYENNTLIESHRTTPGSGVVYHEYYNNNAVTSSQVETTAVDKSEPQYDLFANNSSLTASAKRRELGYMHYRHLNGTVYSIKCYVLEDYYENQQYTFRKDAAKTLSDWITTIVSIYMFLKNPAGVAANIVNYALALGVFSKAVNGVLTVLMTKTVTCNYYNQEIHGDSTSHSGRPHGVLTGTLCYTKIDGQIKKMTEGYTSSHWGNGNMGRQMMYKVHSIDEAPTSWTNT